MFDFLNTRTQRIGLNKGGIFLDGFALKIQGQEKEVNQESFKMKAVSSKLVIKVIEGRRRVKFVGESMNEMRC